MGEIVNFFKDMFNMNAIDNNPIGLCSCDSNIPEKTSKKAKVKRKREYRLSELMDK